MVMTPQQNKKKRGDEARFFGFILFWLTLGMITVALIGFTVGKRAGEEKVRREAVEEGAAVYWPDQYGQRHFKWSNR